MEIDDEESDLPTSSSGKGEKKRFEVKKVRNVVKKKIQILYLSIFIRREYTMSNL